MSDYNDSYDNDYSDEEVVELSAEDFALIATDIPPAIPFIDKQVIVTYGGDTKAFNLIPGVPCIDYLKEFCKLYNVSFDPQRIIAKNSNNIPLDLLKEPTVDTIYMSKSVDEKG